MTNRGIFAEENAGTLDPNLENNVTVTVYPGSKNIFTIKGLPGIPYFNFHSDVEVDPEVLAKTLQNPSEKLKLCGKINLVLAKYLRKVRIDVREIDVREIEEGKESLEIPKNESSSNTNPLVIVDQIKKTFTINGFPGMPSITFPSPKGVKPDILARKLSIPRENFELRYKITIALEEYLSEVKNNSSKVIGSEGSLEIPRVPKWVECNYFDHSSVIRSLQRDLTDFNLELDEAENRLIQVVGGLIILQQVWDNYISKDDYLKKDFAKKYSEALWNQLRQYITYFTEKRLLGEANAVGYIYELAEACLNMSDRGYYTNPINYLLDDGETSKGAGVVPRLVRDVICNKAERSNKVRDVYIEVFNRDEDNERYSLYQQILEIIHK